jgi:hypothetical protein
MNRWREVRPRILPVIASKAKQSIASAKRKMDCFVATLLATTRKDLYESLT